MKYPVFEVDTRILKTNTQIVVKQFSEVGIDISGVTKAFCANPLIAQSLVDGGVTSLADSRIDNLKKLSHIPVSKMCLRLPMLSEVEDVVEYADISLNSEIQTVEALAHSAKSKGKKHNILMMVDLGDLREGVLPRDALTFAERILKFEGVTLKGIGVNFNCFGGVLPTQTNLCELVSIAREIERTLNIKFDIISGGNSGSLYLLKDKKIPEGINHLRIGEAILRGYETSYQQQYDGLGTDAFTFIAQIIELKYKPSVPFGEIGLNAFGIKPHFKDNGIIKRAILACGLQDIKFDQLIPKDEKITILAASSDHMIIDITHSNKTYKLGDTIRFNVEYGALVQASTSEYVSKVII
jgi:ornithine racemase